MSASEVKQTPVTSVENDPKRASASSLQRFVLSREGGNETART